MYPGDISDDDAAVIESLTRANAEPPTAVQLPQVPGVHVPATARPARPTRLMTGTMTFSTANPDPVQILWLDPDRLSILLTVYSATATDSIRIMDESAKNGSAGSGQQPAVLHPAGSAYPLGAHTGALWVAPEAGTAVRVSWVAVSK